MFAIISKYARIDRVTTPPNLNRVLRVDYCRTLVNFRDLFIIVFIFTNI